MSGGSNLAPLPETQGRSHISKARWSEIKMALCELYGETETTEAALRRIASILRFDETKSSYTVAQAAAIKRWRARRSTNAASASET